MKFIRPLFLATLAIFGSHAYSQKTDIYSHLKTDITYLSSDKLEGRLTGSPGEKLSADYIVSQFKSAGLRSLHDTLVQQFDIVKLRLAMNQCIFKMFMGNEGGDFSQSFRLYEEFFPLSESSNNDSTTADLATCGYGIEADALGHNDYKDLTDLTGKIFVISMGFPSDSENPHGPLEAYSGINTKIKTAIAHGASGIIFIPGSTAVAEPKGELQRNVQTYSIPIIYFKKLIPPGIRMQAKIKTTIAAPTAKATNVYAYKNNHKKNTVIICAHHDHLGHNEYKNSTIPNSQELHNGADDNASGVAAMLQLARELKGRKFRKNNYLFVAFSGEELGLLGSKYFVENCPVPLKSINYVINIDMLGRLDSSKRTLIVNGTGTSPVWNESLTKIKTDSTLIKISTSESGLGPSDHASFYVENIPVLHFFTGHHDDYHKPTDDEEKINYEGIVLSCNVIKQTIAATNKAGKLPFTKTKDVQPGSRSFKITLGIMPNYGFSGVGVKVDAVTDGKPAALAGLQKDDVIVKLGNREIANIQDYTAALAQLKNGEKTTVTVMRKGELKTFNIQF